MIKPIQLFVLLFLFCSPVMAGTIIEIQNNNELTTVITDGQKVRMNMSESEYAILDYSNHSAKIINPQQKQVMFLNVNDMTAGNNVAKVQISINKLGSGQVIAGYKTQKFSYQVNGRSCGVIYGSKSAYQANGIKELVAALKTLMEKQRAALGGFASLVDVCTLADMQLMDHVTTVGLPLRSEKNGRVELEIKSIKADVILADDTFVIPASYKILGAKQQIKTVSTAISTERAKPQQQRQQAQMRQHRQLPPQAMKAVPTAAPTAISTERARLQQQAQQAQLRQSRQLPPQVMKAVSTAAPTEMARLQQQMPQPQMRQYRRPPPQAWQQMRPAPGMMRRYQYPGY